MAKAKYKAKTQSTSHSAFTMLEDVLAVAGTILRKRKDRSVDALQSMSSATRDYVAALPDVPGFRATADSAVERFDEIVEYARNTDVEEMVSDAVAFARKHPLATVGLTLAAGILAAQLLRTKTVPAKAKPSRSKARKKAKILAKPRRKVNGTAHANA